MKKKSVDKLDIEFNIMIMLFLMWSYNISPLTLGITACE